MYFDKVTLSYKERGAVVHQSVPLLPCAPFYSNAVSFGAEGPFGSVFYHETRCDDLLICESYYHFRQDTTLSFVLELEYLGLNFILRNNLHYQVKGNRNGLFAEHRYNMVYIPSTQFRCTCLFEKEKKYTFFKIHFAPQWLESWHEPFPVVGGFLDRIERQVSALISPEHLPATARMTGAAWDMLRNNFIGEDRQKYQVEKAGSLFTACFQHISARVGTLLLPADDLEQIRLVEAHILKNLRKDYTLEDLAPLVGISTSKLQRNFKKVHGMTVFAFKMEAQLTAAERLTRNTALSFKEIAYKTGFRNISHFSFSFRTRFGKSPSAYRKKYYDGE